MILIKIFQFVIQVKWSGGVLGDGESDGTYSTSIGSINITCTITGSIVINDFRLINLIERGKKEQENN
jgi:hypothetical protein